MYSSFRQVGCSRFVQVSQVDQTDGLLYLERALLLEVSF